MRWPTVCLLQMRAVGEPYAFRPLIRCATLPPCKKNTSADQRHRDAITTSRFHLVLGRVPDDHPDACHLPCSSNATWPGHANETAFQILHKLRSGMVRPEREPIGAKIPLKPTNASFGASTNKNHCRRCRRSPHAQDAAQRAEKYAQSHPNAVPRRQLVYAGRLRLRVIEQRSAWDLMRFINNNVAKRLRSSALTTPKPINLARIRLHHETLKWLETRERRNPFAQDSLGLFQPENVDSWHPSRPLSSEAFAGVFDTNTCSGSTGGFTP